MVSKDSAQLLETPLPNSSDEYNGDSNRARHTMKLKLRDAKGDHAHQHFAARPSMNVHGGGPGTKYAGGYGKVVQTDLEAQENVKKMEFAKKLAKEGASDVFKSSMWYFNFLCIILFIVLELKLVANPKDMFKYVDYKNVTNITEAGNEELVEVAHESIWGYRNWIHWNFDTHYHKCGFERQFIWTKNGGVFNHDLCFKNWAGWVLIVISRSSAAMMYIFFTTVILTKLRFLLSVAQTTQLSDVWPFHMFHEIHAASGKILLVDTWLHTCCHLLRFFLNSDSAMFYAAVTISGWWAFVVMNLICGVWNRARLTCPVRAVLSAAAGCFGKLSFETEYLLHMSWATFAVAMFWHRYRHGVYWCVVLAVFLADRMLERCLLTQRVRDLELKAGKSGTLIRFMWYNNRTGRTVAPVELAGSIVRINLPKFSTSQYHPFSAFYDPYDVRYACVYIHNAGNWTGLLHEYARYNRHLPHAWIAGPLFSEFQACMQYRNILCVCSGTAIAPIMGLAQYWEPGEHTVTVIWILRDKGLIAQLIPCMNPATKVILHYTGKKTDPETGKKVQDMLNEDDHHDVAFFDRPEVSTINPVAQLEHGELDSAAQGLRASSPGPAALHPAGKKSVSEWKEEGRQIDVVLGRPRDLEKLVLENIVQCEDDPLAENCVAISTGVIPMAIGLEEACDKHKIPSVRCDASFG